jgi:hypothetical protein
MALRLLGYIDLPAHRGAGGFDHADVYSPSDRLYVAHTSNDAIDVIDIARDQYIESMPSRAVVCPVAPHLLPAYPGRVAALDGEDCSSIGRVGIVFGANLCPTLSEKKRSC